MTDLLFMVKKTYSEILPTPIDAAAVEARLKARPCGTGGREMSVFRF
ncbi:MAG: hypothetical protein ACE369_11655 [Roseovarius sp.]